MAIKIQNNVNQAAVKRAKQRKALFLDVDKTLAAIDSDIASLEGADLAQVISVLKNTLTRQEMLVNTLSGS